MRILAVMALFCVGAVPAVNQDTLAISTPTGRQIVQRGDDNQADVVVQGTCGGDVTSIEARTTLMIGGSGKAVDWREICSKSSIAGNVFKGTIRLPAGGWYRLEVRAKNGDRVTASAAVERLGVGEVFVIAGQSNSANHGTEKTTPKDDRISALGEKGWQRADDPLPIATGKGGSPWPTLGDILAKELKVPVGFASVGWGGTAVKEWQPGGKLYPRLKSALERLGKNGARAVLWHQGESDTIAGTSADDYVKLLGNVIRQSRADAGYEIPWIIATVSFIRTQHEAKQPPIREGQKKICDGKTIFPGPDTDDMHGDLRAPDTVHFSGKGLQEHARRWAAVLMKTFFKK